MSHFLRNGVNILVFTIFVSTVRFWAVFLQIIFLSGKSKFNHGVLLCSGRDLAAFLKKEGSIPQDKSHQSIMDLARGMQHLQSMMIVHFTEIQSWKIFFFVTCSDTLVVTHNTKTHSTWNIYGEGQEKKRNANQAEFLL